VQEKAIAHPIDSRLLEVARGKVVEATKAGIPLKQTFAEEGKTLRWRGGGDAHAKQSGRLERVLKRQRTILGIVLREIGRKRPEAGRFFCALGAVRSFGEISSALARWVRGDGEPWGKWILQGRLHRVHGSLADGRFSPGDSRNSLATSHAHTTPTRRFAALPPHAPPCATAAPAPWRHARIGQETPHRLRMGERPHPIG
jgi:hypothetical protein